MNPLSKHRTKITIVVFLLLAALGTVAIFWARGFKPNFKNGTIERTGLIVADSVPTGAQVYLDDRLTSATNTSIAFLEPKTYKVRIEKEGFTKWEKEVTVIADLATEIHALLFPLAPEIKPLTTTGALSNAGISRQKICLLMSSIWLLHPRRPCKPSSIGPKVASKQERFEKDSFRKTWIPFTTFSMTPGQIIGVLCLLRGRNLNFLASI